MNHHYALYSIHLYKKKNGPRVELSWISRSEHIELNQRFHPHLLHPMLKWRTETWWTQVFCCFFIYPLPRTTQVSSLGGPHRWRFRPTWWSCWCGWIGLQSQYSRPQLFTLSGPVDFLKIKKQPKGVGWFCRWFQIKKSVMFWNI